MSDQVFSVASAPEQPLARAAQYVRMSTEHQKYSTENQADTIALYAAKRGFEIVRTYADAGKSGLRLDGREALQKLIADVRTGAADFTTILVYDVSRWGRFQDADESAYYEMLCKHAGLKVVYCAEQFDNDGSPAPDTSAADLIRPTGARWSSPRRLPPPPPHRPWSNP